MIYYNIRMNNPNQIRTIRLPWVLVAIAILVSLPLLANRIPNPVPDAGSQTPELLLQTNINSEAEPERHPLSVTGMRNREYPGSELTVEETLPPGTNYRRYIASYLSEGLKQYGLLTIPTGTAPESGWPVIVFNHGFIPPAQYRTTERYVAYVDAFARNGFMVYRPDYRGHDRSEGIASGGYGSPDYTIDVLNAVASVKRHPSTDPDRIGMWGHSMGGHITLRSMVVTRDIKAGVIWGGVVASYPDLISRWRRRNPTPVEISPQPGPRRWRDLLTEQYGNPETNPEFWSDISPISFVTDVSGPIQLHHAKGDASVPYEFSVKLDDAMNSAGVQSELYLYEGDDHDITANFALAMNRSVTFFQKHL